MNEKSIVISYETLFEMLRLERSRTELQELPKNFVEEARKLLDSDIAFMNSLDEDERQKKKVSIQNTIKILGELHERREKKIANIALAKSKTKSAIIDFAKFLEHEKEMFYEILGILDKYREMSNKTFLMENGTRKEERRSEGSQSAPSFQETRQEKNEEKKEAPITTDSNTGTEKIEAKKENDAKTVRFISAFPRFLGTNLEEYGPFMEEDITVLPVKIADVLVKKKRAEEIAAK